MFLCSVSVQVGLMCHAMNKVLQHNYVIVINNDNHPSDCVERYPFFSKNLFWLCHFWLACCLKC